MARSAGALDQATAIEDRMDGAFGRTRISPSSRLTSSSRILRAPQCGFRPLSGQSGSRSAPGAGWYSAPAASGDRSRLPAMFPVAVENLVAGLAGYAEF